MQKKFIQYLSLGLIMTMSASVVFAQDKYQYCQQQAKSASGYYGEVPDEYLPGGALKGAMRGAATGAAIGWIGGKKGKKARRATRRGAALGALIGGIKRAKAKDDINKRRRAYEFEMQMCMSSN